MTGTGLPPPPLQSRQGCKWTSSWESDPAPQTLQGVAQHQLLGSHKEGREGRAASRRTGGAGSLSPAGAPSPHLSAGNHAIGRELFSQLLIIDGVIQVLNVQVHALEREVTAGCVPSPPSPGLPCVGGLEALATQPLVSNLAWYPCPPVTQHAHPLEATAPNSPTSKAKFTDVGLPEEGFPLRALHTHGHAHIAAAVTRGLSPGNGSPGPASSARTYASAHSAVPPASGPGPRTAAARSPPSHSCPSQPGQGRGENPW